MIRSLNNIINNVIKNPVTTPAPQRDKSVDLAARIPKILAKRALIFPIYPISEIVLNNIRESMFSLLFQVEICSGLIGG